MKRATKPKASAVKGMAKKAQNSSAIVQSINQHLPDTSLVVDSGAKWKTASRPNTSCGVVVTKYAQINEQNLCQNRHRSVVKTKSESALIGSDIGSIVMTSGNNEMLKRLFDAVEVLKRFGIFDSILFKSFQCTKDELCIILFCRLIQGYNRLRRATSNG